MTPEARGFGGRLLLQQKKPDVADIDRLQRVPTSNFFEKGFWVFIFVTAIGLTAGSGFGFGFFFGSGCGNFDIPSMALSSLSHIPSRHVMYCWNVIHFIPVSSSWGV